MGYRYLLLGGSQSQLPTRAETSNAAFLPLPLKRRGFGAFVTASRGAEPCPHSGEKVARDAVEYMVGACEDSWVGDSRKRYRLASPPAIIAFDQWEAVEGAIGAESRY